VAGCKRKPPITHKDAAAAGHPQTWISGTLI